MDGNARADILDPSLLDYTLPTPLYHQLYLVLRQKIRSGSLPSESGLPGEQELSRKLGVSRITVKRALQDLADEGLVTRHRGRGTFVAPNMVLPMVSGSFENLIDSLHAMGAETEVELLAAVEEPADPHTAERLDIAVGARVQRAVRLRRLAGEPFSYLITYVPAAVAAHYSTEDLASTPMLSLLERAGLPAASTEQWITATGAPPPIAAALGVAVASPLLEIQRVMSGPSGAPIQFMKGYYHPDRFQYHIVSKRLKSRRAGKPAQD
jgi:GntR family transcriptional regulator